MRQIFEAAAAQAPSVLFIDALDVIAGKKDVRSSPLSNAVVQVRLIKTMVYHSCSTA